ncbi:MAG: pyridoxal 5'-phosphate synthase glutaminase subunit PdxT [Bdellovibrionaceae bacterium]|nr:pyridoxal 5'-phosphate synthase glutaminase subunit PdxT [Pseudobdellovibrionaceae bacterium]
MKSVTDIRIGVLAIQGAFQTHKPHIESLGAKYIEVRDSDDFNEIDGLILPGGESGTVLKLIDLVGIKNSLKSFAKSKPVWGVCAGAILMASKVHGPEQESFGAMEIEIIRNAYGRQAHSSEETIDNFRVSYIRAPKITKVAPALKVLASRDKDPVWVESDLHMVTTFHPEMSQIFGSRWHQRLISKCKATVQLR